MNNNDKIAFSRNIWKYYLISIFHGFWFIVAIDILYYLSFDLSFTKIATFALVYAIITIFLEVPSGAISDILGRKKTTIIGYTLSAIAIFMIGFGSTYVVFLFAAAIWGIADTLLSGNLSALLYDSLKKIKKEKTFMKVKGKILLFEAVTIFVASIIGVYLFEINRSYPWILMGIFLTLATIVSLSLKEPHISKKRLTLKNQYSHMKESFRFSLSHKKIRWLIIFASIITLPIYAFGELIRQPFLIGIGFEVISLGLIIGLIHGLSGLVASFSERIEKRIGEFYSFVGITLTYIIMFFLSALILNKIAAIFIAILYIARDYQHILVENYINHHVKSEKRATVLSIQAFISSSMFAIFGLIVGFSIDLFSIRIVLFGFALFLTIFCIPFLFRTFSKSETNA
jgi:MFS family permease